jgi:hypothetical protein
MTMFYYTYEFKSLTDNTKPKLIHIEISESAIRPKEECECGICQNDGSICGYFEGLIEDVEDDGGFVAKCAKRWC